MISINVHSFSQRFPSALLLNIIPAPLAAILLVLIFPESQPPDMDLSGKPMDVLLSALSTSLLIPAIENFILVWPTAISRQAIPNKWLASFIGAIPIIALHGISGWQKSFAVTWSFTWQAYCFISLTEAGKSFRYRYFFTAAMHAAFNSLCVAFFLLAEG